MASFDAQIKLIVDAQAALSAIDKFTSAAEKKLKKLPAFVNVNDEKLNKQLDGLNAQIRLGKRLRRQAQEKLQTEERKLSVQLRIAAAQERQAALEKALTRAGVSGGRRKEADEVLAAANANKKNLSTLLATNAALEKILQTQREINRTDLAQQKGQRDVRAFNERIRSLEAFGRTEGELARSRKLAATLDEQVSRKQLDLAKKTQAQLEQQLRSLEKFVALETKRGTFPASPVRGTAETPGSPKYYEAVERAARKAEAAAYRLERQQERARRAEVAAAKQRDRDLKKAQKGYISSPIRGRATMEGSPKYYEAVERAARKAEVAAARLAREEARAQRAAAAAARQRERDARAAEAQQKREFRAAQKNAPSSPVRGSAKIEGSPIFLEQRRKAQDRLSAAIASAQAKQAAAEERLEQQALQSIAKQTRARNKFDQDRRRAQDRLSAALERDYKKRIANEERLARVQERAAAQQAKQAKEQKQGRLSSAVVGAGFPLLFGGGLGSILGGGLGGALGGKEFGFAASIGASAVGAQLDKLAVFARSTGDALKEPTKALQQLETIGFQVSDATKTQVEALIENGRANEALAIIHRQVASVIGNQGINALTDFDNAVDKLQDSIAKAALIIISELVPALTTAIDVIANGVRDITGPNLQRQAANINPAAFQEAQTRVAGQTSQFGIVGNRAEYERLLTLEAIKIVEEANLEINKQITSEGIKQAADTAAKAREARLETAVLQAQLGVLEAGKDLTDDKVYARRQAVIQAEFEVAAEKELKDGTSDVNAQLQRRIALRKLELERAEAVQRAQEKAAREAERAAREAQRAAEEAQRSIRRAAQSKLSLDAEFIRTALTGNDIDIEYSRLYEGEAAALQKQVDTLETRFNLEVRILDKNLQRKLLAEDITATEERLLRKIYNEQADNLETQYNLKLRSLRVAQAELDLDIELARVDRERQFEDELNANQADIDRGVVGLEFPFDKNAQEQVLQLLDQQERRLQQILPLTREIEDLQLKLATGFLDNEAKPEAERRIYELERQRDALHSQLDVLDQLEQRQLRLNQITQDYGFLADEVAGAVSASVSAIITGTGSVEEAFSRMFTSIGNQFVQMATQMMAQRLFMTVLNAFGGGVGGGTFGIGPVGGGLFGGGSLGLSSGFGTFAGGGYTGDGPRSGGVDGEGGFPAILHPQETVIDHSNLRSGMSGNRGGGTSLSMSFQTTKFMDREWVDREQLESAMAQAAKDGGKRGEERTIARLQRSPQTRNRLGLR